MKNVIGTKVGDYIVVSLKGIFDQKRIYIVECCICGHRREMQLAEFMRIGNKHSVKNCKEDYMKSEVGKKYGDFVIVGYTDDWKYKCKCTVCGKTKVLIYNEIQNLKRVSHKWCAIGDNDNTKEWRKFHSIWTSMRTRTTNQNAKHYKDYGGRGISSDDYKDFLVFKRDFYDEFLLAIEKYGFKEVSIDRIDNNGSYTKGNIRFTDKRTQATNTRKIKNIIAKSPSGCIYHLRVIKDFAEEHGLCRSCITLCLKGKQDNHKGWKFEYENC